MKKPDYSVFLEDYIDIGIFEDDDENETELYLKTQNFRFIIKYLLLLTKNLRKLVLIHTIN